jgi:hypothetical protein
MKVALLISGRLKCYETCLLPLLQNSSYDVDVFASINDVDYDYYDGVRVNLSSWLKGLYVSPYSFPKRFMEIFVNINTNLPEPKPYNPMSMFFNDRKAFDMATEYAEENLFEYDAYLKYRSDIITSSLPNIQKSNEYEIYSVVPWCNYTAPVVTRNPVGYGDVVPWVSDAMVYGNQQSMRAYTETHNFCMEMLELFEGRYPCNFEPSVTQNAYDKLLTIKYFNNPYTLDSSRHQ